MTYPRAKTVHCPQIIALLLIHSSVAQAEVYDITELQQPDNSSPAMTGFYTVTPEGETTLEDPVESGFAISAGSDFDPERAPEEEPEKASSGKKKNRETRKVRIRVKRKQPERNRADQFRCERHGFYYTHDGRCILPTYGRSPVIPLPLPGPGMHRRMPD